MKKKYQNAFFIFGLAVLAVMVAQLDFADTWAKIQDAGYWLVAVILLWFVLYFLNTGAWWVIIKNQKPSSTVNKPFGFMWLYKITVSGFALNYATPGGLMGGEPYRIMMLSPKIGTERATASVLLYMMTHAFSHLWFWLLSCLLYVATKWQLIDIPMALIVTAVTCFSSIAIWFFMKGYKRGIANSGMKLLGRIPLVKRWARRFIDEHKEQLDEIDQTMATLHGQNPHAFIGAVLLELSCRIVSALEIFFILQVTPDVHATYLDSILILAFTSLFANLLFFMPLQLGGREGGFLMSAKGLQLTGQAGIFVALIVRLRELVWMAIGLLLIKFDRKEKQVVSASNSTADVGEPQG